jgi:predicted ester cyclase
MRESLCIPDYASTEEFSMKHAGAVLAAAIVCVLVILGCSSSVVQQEAKNKQLFTQGVEAINSRNWDALDTSIAPNYIRHCQATPDVIVNNLDDFKRYLKQDAITFPDSRITIRFLVAEGDLVAFYCTYAGTQKGQLGPFPSSGKQMSLDFSGVHRIENGKLVETWLTWDNLALLAQLGHFPPAEQQTK